MTRGSSRSSTDATAVTELAGKVRAGDRASLARAVTLVESTLPSDQTTAERLLLELFPAAQKTSAVRIGISGSPGVGKSSLIEQLGQRLVASGRRLAVLAVDPSSPLTGGSILGDKTRMVELSRNSSVFIRPQPSRGALGGVARRTRDAMLVCEAAGFNVVIVETVGSGQSDVAVAGMVDFFLVLEAPAAGDGLQGIKKGILELADTVVVTKADGDLANRAESAKKELASALAIGRAGGRAPAVMTTSSTSGLGCDELIAHVQDEVAARQNDGTFAARRRAQAEAAFDVEVARAVEELVQSSEKMQLALKTVKSQVVAGEKHPRSAARAVVGYMFQAIVRSGGSG